MHLPLSPLTFTRATMASFTSKSSQVFLCIWKQHRTMFLESCLAIRGSRPVLSSRPEVPRSRPGTESPIDFVHSSRPRSRPRQGKVKIETGLEPNTGQDSRERVVFNRNSLNFGALLPCEQLCLASAVEEAELYPIYIDQKCGTTSGGRAVSTPCPLSI